MKTSTLADFTTETGCHVRAFRYEDATVMLMFDMEQPGDGRRGSVIFTAAEWQSLTAAPPTLEEAHAHIHQRVTDLQVTTYFGDDGQARAFRAAQAARLLPNDPKVQTALAVIREASE